MNALTCNEALVRFLQQHAQKCTPAATVTLLVPARRRALAKGDVCYVREPWRIHVGGWSTSVDYAYGGGMNLGGGSEMSLASAWITRHGAFLDFEGARADRHHPEWLPAAQMPWWASRFRLTVVEEPTPTQLRVTVRRVFPAEMFA